MAMDDSFKFQDRVARVFDVLFYDKAGESEIVGDFGEVAA
jgi:hypothetical protein